MRVTQYDRSLELTDARGWYSMSAVVVGMAVVVLGILLERVTNVFDRPAMVAGAAAVVVVLFGLVMSGLNRLRTTTVCFIHGEKEVIVQRRRLFTRRLDALVVPTREIEEAFVETAADEDARFYYVTLRLRDGRTMRLSEIGYGLKKGRSDAVAAINEFLARQRR